MHHLYYLFLLALFIAIYSLNYLCFLLYLLISTFIVVPFFLTQCINLFVDKRVMLSLLLHNLTLSCSKCWDDDPVRDLITHEVKICAYDNDNNDNNNDNNKERAR